MPPAGAQGTSGGGTAAPHQGRLQGKHYRLVSNSGVRKVDFSSLLASRNTITDSYSDVRKSLGLSLSVAQKEYLNKISEVVQGWRRCLTACDSRMHTNESLRKTVNPRPSDPMDLELKLGHLLLLGTPSSLGL